MADQKKVSNKTYDSYEEFLADKLPVLADLQLRKKLALSSVDFGVFLAGKAAERVAARFAARDRIRS
jgi:hypothetical protein